MATQCERCSEHNPEDARFCKGCGAPLVHAAPTGADPLINQVVLDRYVIKHLIGEGGMGRVYAAEQRVGTTTRRVAVKTLLAQLSADPQIVKRFYREAETIVRLSHPNIIAFYDFGALVDGTLVIVMEYIEGESLAQCLSRGPISTQRADAILAQVCGALSEAHSLGIVHRDLKPDNILLTTRGGQSDFVKVLDFGIAKISAQEQELGAATKLTQQGMIIGTPPYMSPEQFRGDPVDARSDIYSLGVIAYEMHTARLPFDAKTPWEWASKHLTAEPESLRVDVSAGVSEERAAAIRQALAKAPEDRPKDVTEFLHAIRREGASVGASRGPTLALAQVESTRPETSSLRAPAALPARTPQLTEEDIEPPKRPTVPLLAGMVLGALCLGALGVFVMRTPSAEPATETMAPPSLPQADDQKAGIAPSSEEKTKPARTEAAAPTANGSSAVRPSHDATGEPPKPTSSSARHRSSHAKTAAAPEAKPEAMQASALTPTKIAAPANAEAPAPVAAAPVKAAPVAPISPARHASTPVAVAPLRPQAASATTPPELAERVRKGLDQARERPDVALAIYHGAANRYGRGHPALAPLASVIQQHGDRRIRKLVGDGLCAQAQALFRSLASAGLQGGAASAFSGRCAVPR